MSRGSSLLTEREGVSRAVVSRGQGDVVSQAQLPDVAAYTYHGACT